MLENEMINQKITPDRSIRDFKEWTSQETKRSTARVYSWHVKWFMDWLEKQGMVIEDVENPEMVVGEYLKDFAEGRVLGTTRVALYALRRLFYKFLGRDFDTDRVTVWGKESDYEPTILKRDEVGRILENAPRWGERRGLLVKTGWYCALRRSEVVRLKSSLLMGDGVIKCPISKTRKGKKRSKNIEVPSDLYDRLEKLGSGRFIEMSAGEWSSKFKRFAGGLGIEVKWHNFARNTRLTRLAEDTKNFLQVLQISGHQNPAVCRQYFEWAEVKVPELDVVKRARWRW